MRRSLRLAAFVSGTALPSVALAVVALDVSAEPAARGALRGEKRDASAVAAGDAGPDARGARAALRIPPDPPAMSERKQWVFDLRWDRGDVYLLEVHEMDMGAPHATPRVMGRFALELFEGPTLIERVRFDFPMVGPPESADAGSDYRAPPRFAKVRSRIGVVFPATRRGTRLELWDRARDVRFALPWPPTPGVVPGRPDAG